MLAALPSQPSLTGWTDDLSLHDQRVLQDNGWLSANHISAANKLMLKAFPQQNGLQDTFLAKKMSWPSIPKDFVQIIHVGDCHWACLSNKLCKEDNIVELYDSLHMKPGDTVQEQVSTIMNCEAATIIIRVMNIERQWSGHACGLYAIAAAVDLCLGNDPCLSLYDEENMRNHLELCFRKRAIAQFPQQFRDTSQRVLKEISVPVYCICRYPDCTTCLVIWYAVIRVVNGSTSVASAFRTLKLLKWFCFRCAKQ